MGGVSDDTPTVIEPTTAGALIGEMLDTVDYAVTYLTDDTMPPVAVPEDDDDDA